MGCTAIPDSESPNNFGVTKATGDLKSALTDAIPNYDQALAVSGDYLSTAGAFNRAKGKLFNGSFDVFGRSHVGDITLVRGAEKGIGRDSEAYCAVHDLVGGLR